jgi:hypothetical protein
MTSRLATGRRGETICIDEEGHRWLVLDPVALGLTPARGREPTRKERTVAAKYAPMLPVPPSRNNRERRYG